MLKAILKKTGIILLFIITISILNSVNCLAETEKESLLQREVKFLTADLNAQKEVENDSELVTVIGNFEKGSCLSDKELLLEVETKISQLIEKNPENYLCYYYLGRIKSSLMNLYDSAKDKQKIKECINKAEEMFKKSVSLKDNFAESHSYLGFIYGRKIAVEGPLTGILLGKKTIKEHQRALEIDKENPIVLVNLGIYYVYTPDKWGGDKKKAEECFKKAQKISSRFVDGYVWLGILYEGQGKEKEAIKLYQKALEIEPQNKRANTLIKKHKT